ncbi:MAG TPA: hypothetical protein VM287_00430 [Egibacteraceae bacterium]|nr:hypothetical protein [Egibacteraceae bacterium]
MAEDQERPGRPKDKGSDGYDVVEKGGKQPPNPPPPPKMEAEPPPPPKPKDDS